MENLRKKMKIDHHVPLTSKVLEESNSTHSKNLLDLPDEVIEMILDNLNIFDQDSFSVCCKKINEIFKSRSKYTWHKIQKSQKATDLTRPYAKVIWQCDKVPEVKEEVWSHLAPSLKGLKIRGRGKQLGSWHRLQVSENLIAALPHFGNIVYWQFADSDWFVEYLKKIPVSQVAEMSKLEHLEIKSSLLLILDERFIKFSSDKLNTLILKLDHLKSKKNYTDLISFISRQKKMEKLCLNDKGYVETFFNKPLKLENIQLKEIDLTIDRLFGIIEQSCLVDFLESQKQVGLRNCKLNLYYSVKTQKMKNFQMSLLDIPMISMTFTILQHQSHSLYINTITGNCGDFEFTEFLKFQHRENSVVENLDLTLRRGATLQDTVVNHDILSCICSKFPNLKKLKLVAKTNWDTFESIALQPLGTLESLESFELIWISFFYQQEILSQVTIPNLKKFVYNQYFIDPVNSMDLISFLARHENITHLKLTTMYSPGFFTVLKFTVKTLKKLVFIESSWWIEDSAHFNEIKQSMESHAKSGLVMKLVQRDGVNLTLTKGDANDVIVETQMEVAEDEDEQSKM